MALWYWSRFWVMCCWVPVSPGTECKVAGGKWMGVWGALNACQRKKGLAASYFLSGGYKDTADNTGSKSSNI